MGYELELREGKYILFYTIKLVKRMMLFLIYYEQETHSPPYSYAKVFDLIQGEEIEVSASSGSNLIFKNICPGLPEINDIKELYSLMRLKMGSCSLIRIIVFILF